MSWCLKGLLLLYGAAAAVTFGLEKLSHWWSSIRPLIELELWLELLAQWCFVLLPLIGFELSFYLATVLVAWIGWRKVFPEPLWASGFKRPRLVLSLRLVLPLAIFLAPHFLARGILVPTGIPWWGPLPWAVFMVISSRFALRNELDPLQEVQQSRGLHRFTRRGGARAESAQARAESLRARLDLAIEKELLGNEWVPKTKTESSNSRYRATGSLFLAFVVYWFSQLSLFALVDADLTPFPVVIWATWVGAGVCTLILLSRLLRPVAILTNDRLRLNGPLPGMAREVRWDRVRRVTIPNTGGAIGWLWQKGLTVLFWLLQRLGYAEDFEKGRELLSIRNWPVQLRFSIRVIGDDDRRIARIPLWLVGNKLDLMNELVSRLPTECEW